MDLDLDGAEPVFIERTQSDGVVYGISRMPPDCCRLSGKYAIGKPEEFYFLLYRPGWFFSGYLYRRDNTGCSKSLVYR